MNRNDEMKLEITSMSSSGSGVGHINGLAVFAAGTCPGDVITAHIIFVKKNYAIAKIKSIDVSSPDRAENDCKAFPSCGGCAYRHIKYEKELEIKRQCVADAMKRIGHLDIDVMPVTCALQHDRYRNKSQMPAEMQNGILKTGFYAYNSHRIIDISDCRLSPSVFSVITDIIKKWAHDTALPDGILRHIYLRQSYAGKNVCVCLVTSCDTLPFSESLIKELSEIKEVSGIVLNVNKADTNVILGNTIKTLYGTQYLTDVINGTLFRISPLSFYQVNPSCVQLLYEKAAELSDLKSTDTLLDLYCGAGTIGLTMAHQCKKLIGAEIVQSAVDDAKENARINGIENAEFICADAAQAAKQLASNGLRPDVITLDPPRKGLSPDVIDTVAQMAPSKIVYVSCDPATLARDAALFETRGYKADKAFPYDMFPRTAHVETVCLMSRVKK